MTILERIVAVWAVANVIVISYALMVWVSNARKRSRDWAHRGPRKGSPREILIPSSDPGRPDSGVLAAWSSVRTENLETTDSPWERTPPDRSEPKD